jgi:predicted  nucleic acid-binding Zn-ribbon protein
MQALDELNSKINLLLKKHAALEAENKRLKDAVTRHEKSEAKLNKQLAKLEKDMVSVNLKAAINDDEDRQNMRRQLDLAITEIDRILTTLND